MRGARGKLFLLAAALALPAIQRAAQPRAFAEEPLLANYRANNEVPAPVVCYLVWGFVNAAVFPDGRTLTPGRRSTENPSGVLDGHLDESALVALLESVRGAEDFHRLESFYRLTRWSEQPDHIISLRLPGTAPKTVRVYGNLTPQMKDEQTAPEAFVRLAHQLRAIQPADAKPFDPGYVEVAFADYSHAPDASIPWPAEWPRLKSPLCRETPKWVTKRMMIFPSSEIAALEAFLHARKKRGAILIDGWKASADVHWPLPGEKKWTSWSE